MAAVAFGILAITPLGFAAEGFHTNRTVDPTGEVEVLGINGSIEIDGWDRSEVEVTGPEDLGDRVRLTGHDTKTTIHIRPGGGEGSDARVIIHVPAKSDLSVVMVSGNLKVGGLQGDANLRTVSGNVTGEVGGDVRVNTATGFVHLTALTAKSTQVRTINGNVELKGGSGDVEVQTVSGDAKLDFNKLTRGHFHSISGNLSANLDLATDADLDSESVSGNLKFDFPGAPSADFDVQSFSGGIDNCFGPKAEQAHYGPGSRLEFKNGKGQAHVRIETKSGDVHLCSSDSRRTSGASSRRDGAPVRAAVANCRRARDIFYVI
jgi:hypothetical protein